MIMADKRDWKQRIVELVLVKQRLHEVDSAGLWQYRLPGLAATEKQLAAVEEKLGEPLDHKYRAFLKFAGGWPAFFQDIDLFGPQDLLGGARFERALERLGYLEQGVLAASGVRRDELLPIATSAEDRSLFVITKTTTAHPGMVIWYSGAEVDRFVDFDEFYAAMVDYNRAEIQQLQH